MSLTIQVVWVPPTWQLRDQSSGLIIAFQCSCGTITVYLVTKRYALRETIFQEEAVSRVVREHENLHDRQLELCDTWRNVLRSRVQYGRAVQGGRGGCRRLYLAHRKVETCACISSVCWQFFLRSISFLLIFMHASAFPKQLLVFLRPSDAFLPLGTPSLHAYISSVIIRVV